MENNKKPEYISKADNSIIMPAVALAVVIALLLVMTLAFFVIARVSGAGDYDDFDDIHVNDGDDDDGDKNEVKSPFKQEITNFYPTYVDEGLVSLSSAGLNSPNVALVDVAQNKIIASSKSDKTNIIYPASMTKVMTLIVVYENLTSQDQLKHKITLDAEVVDRMVAEQSSGYGFKAGEVLTVEELIHAVILYSDGVASVTLANYVAGSEADFVKLMNAKATEMGLQNTLFQNCTGLHHKYHYSTCQDMAAIMMYAMKNPHCANVLTAESFTLGSHFRPDNDNTYTLYNQALHTSKFTQPGKVTVTAAKTGWTEDELSGYCLVSYGKNKDGKAFILVTAGADSTALRNEDTVKIYDTYAK